MTRIQDRRNCRPHRQTYWVIQKTTLGLMLRLLEIRTSLEITPRRSHFIARSLGGDLLRPRSS